MTPMSLKNFHLLKNLWYALKEFFLEEGVDKASILAYYSIFSSLFLLTFFTFLFTRFLGDPDLTLKTVYPFSPDFFSKVSPDIFDRAANISAKLKDVGVIGILFSFILGFLVIIKIVQFVNAMFHVNLKAKRYEKGFWIRRVSEFSLLFLLGVLVVVSFFFTGVVYAVTSLLQENQFLASHINSHFIDAVNAFFIKFMAPFLITFLFFFVLYKWIPEKKVYVKGALVSAFTCTLLWEIAKRGYTYYLVKISIFGKIKGPVIAIILFGFWMELSMGIMLYGAKLTYIFDKEKSFAKEENDQPKRDKPESKRRAQGKPQLAN
jgi:membrane protein